MANRTAWTGGNGQGLTWGALFNGADLNKCANGNTCLSSANTITNGTSLDMFMDVSANCSISSSTIAAGANLTLWIMELGEDGTAYGDNCLATGANAAVTPGLIPAAVMPLRAAAATTILYGYAQGVIIPPGTFLCALQNNSGFTLSAANNVCSYRTYNINLNN